MLGSCEGWDLAVRQGEEGLSVEDGKVKSRIGKMQSFLLLGSMRKSLLDSDAIVIRWLRTAPLFLDPGGPSGWSGRANDEVDSNRIHG